ncbi:MAG: YfhO family protein [Blastocatellia bacterium]
MPIKDSLEQFLAPRARNLLTYLFLILLPPIFFWRETLGWMTLGDKDAIFWFFPAYKFVAEQLRSGSLPLWNPYQYSGAPLFAEWQAGTLDPINWIYLIETTSRTLTLSLEISFATALVATFSYARSIGFNRRASVVSAIIYALSGFAVGRTLYPGFLHITALAPFVLYFVEKLYQRGRWRDVIGGALIIAWQVFAAHPQPLIYSSLLACAYALFCALRKTGESQIANLKSRIVFLVKFALMFIAGACLSAVQLIPAAEFARQSVRREWPFELFTLHSLHPVSLLTTLFPFFHGEGRGIYRMPYWGVYWHHNEAQIYLGVIALSLAIAGAIVAWRARFSVGVFWSCVAVAGVILAIGKYSGPIARAIYHVPVISNFRSPNRHWVEVTLAVAILAGYAVDRLLREESRLLARYALAASASLAALCVVVGGFVLWRKDLAEALIKSAPGLSQMPSGFLQSAGAEFYLPMITAVCAYLAIRVFTKASERSQWYALLPILLIADFHLYAAFAPIRNPEKLESLVGAAMPKSLAAKQSERDPIRYHVALNPASGEFNPFWFYGAEMVTGYDPVLNERYKIFSGIDEAGRSFISTLLDSRDHTLDLLNVRYVFVPPASFDPAAAKATGAGAPVELTRGKSATFKAGNGAGDTLTIVSSLTNSAEIGNGEVVAEISVKCESGARWLATLRAGRQTSEWAYDRADVRSVIKHSRAKIAESWSGDAASSFQGHSYIARIGLPKNLRTCRLPRTVEVKATTPGDATISVKKIAFEVSATGRELTLAQTLSDSLSDTARWREVAERSETNPYGAFRIFENLRSMPRAWLVDRARVEYEGDQLKLIRGELAGQSFDPRRTALLDHATAATLNPALVASAEETGEKEPEVAKAGIIERKPTQIVIEAEAQKPSILVLGEIDYPGWKVTIDGVESGLLRVNYNLRGVELPAGRRRIELIYRPASLTLGAVVSITTALGLLLIGLWERRRAKTIKDAGVV